MWIYGKAIILNQKKEFTEKRVFISVSGRYTDKCVFRRLRSPYSVEQVQMKFQSEVKEGNLFFLGKRQILSCMSSFLRDGIKFQRYKQDGAIINCLIYLVADYRGIV